MVAVLALAASPHAASADPPPPPGYEASVQQAYDILQGAQPSDPLPAERAKTILIAGTGQSQPEILGDLSLRPPDYSDANARLQALLALLAQPINTADPATAQQRLHDVLAMHRYDSLHQPPTLIDRLLQWLRDRLDQFFRLFGGHGTGGGGIPLWVLYVIGGLVMLAVAVYIVLSARGTIGGAGGGRRHRPGRLVPPGDHFAEADRLAAAGDRVGATRELCAGVAGVLAGERTWEGSPLTVREIFRSAPDFAALRPLLLPFEAAVYGGRDVDSTTYERAAEVAAPFRAALEPKDEEEAA